MPSREGSAATDGERLIAATCAGCGLITTMVDGAQSRRVPQCPDCAGRTRSDPEWWRLAAVSWRRQRRAERRL